MNEDFRLYEVLDSAEKKEFLNLPVALYKSDINYIRPLDIDIEKVFNPTSNKFFRTGDCIRWILKNGEDKTIGRVAAFYEKTVSGKQEQPTGGMGFFECINNQSAANILFDACKQWLQKRGMEAMDGPVNFGDRDRWWGLLVEGFTEPNYCVPYNFPYYRDLFEAYGFRNYFNQFTYHRYINSEGLSDSVKEKAERVFRNSSYSFSHSSKKNIEKIADDFRIVYNKAWANHSGVKETTKAHAMALLNSLKPILDEKLIWFAYYNGEPVAFFIMIPEFNQVVKFFNGNLNLKAKLKFLYFKIRKRWNKAFGVIFGVIPEHQGKGVEAAIVMAFAKIATRPGFPYKELEMNWIGDFNPAMMKVAEQVGGRICKTHTTYRYLFDRNREFRRAKVLK
jgi:GNAT superfamily N-acetyltransferase